MAIITENPTASPKLIIVETGNGPRAINPSLIIHISQSGDACSILFVNGETIVVKGDINALVKQLNG